MAKSKNISVYISFLLRHKPEDAVHMQSDVMKALSETLMPDL